MNKLNHRLEPSNHISKIQQNLKEMKMEVEGYLKRHNKNSVPPILKGRHYLLLDSINHIGTIRPIQSPRKLIKDLSSEALCSVPEADHLDSLRRLHLQKKEANRIIKQKRTVSGKNNYQNKLEPEQSCLLPNICNINMDHDHLIYNFPMKRPLRDQTPINRDLKDKTERGFNEAKRYQSIDLYRQSYLSEMQPETIRETLRGSKLKWLQKSFSKHLYQNGELINHHGSSGQSEPILQREDHKFGTIQSHHKPSLGDNFLENLSMNQLDTTQNNHSSARKSIFKKIGRQLCKGLPAKHPPTVRLPKPNKQPEIELSCFDPWENEEEQLSHKLFFDKDLQ